MRYRAFADEVRLRMPAEYDMNYKAVEFCLPMPKSWGIKKKQKMAGKPHTQKPDIDNLAKAFLDSLYTDDSHIHTITLSKIWGRDGFIRIDYD